jgi:ABC-type Na+ efflux pump permease subunit
MKTKTRNIINWVLAGVVGFIFIGSAASKFAGGVEALKMAENIGLNPSQYQIIAIVELLSIVLFIIPRTGVLGTLLLSAYMGGAIATHLEHAQSIAAPAGILAFVWIVTVVRFPELANRLLGK